MSFVAESALLIDVMGFLNDPEVAAAAHAACVSRHRSGRVANVAGVGFGQSSERLRRLCNHRREYWAIDLFDSNLRLEMDRDAAADRAGMLARDK